MRDGGFTLAELLVALVLFVLAAAIALLLFRSLTRAHRRGEQVMRMQLSARIGLDLLARDLRQAGLGVDSGGPFGVDEAIEGAWETAVTLRADLDGQESAAREPEDALAGDDRGTVTTGNDEIVTYVLGGDRGETLSFEADVRGVPRDGTLETVTIPRVTLTQEAPPYTLYRVVVRPDGMAVHRSPVTDDVYSLRFLYFDAAGVRVGPSTPQDPDDDIGGRDLPSSRAARGDIRLVVIRLTTMTAAPELGFTDLEDPHPRTRHHRKLTLTASVRPANLATPGSGR